MARLNAIVWPSIKELALEEIRRMGEQEKKSVVILEAAILLEAGWSDLVEETWVVSLPRGIT